MRWYSLPVSIRLKSHYETLAYSGVDIICLDENSKPIDNFIITLCCVLAERCSIAYTNQWMCTEDEVHWIPTQMRLETTLCDGQNDKLLTALNSFRYNGFRLIPLERDVKTGPENVRVLMLRPSTRHTKRLFDIGAYKPLLLHNSSQLKDITVYSFPFNFTDPLMFSNFESHGIINLTSQYQNEILGYLSDIKYLDNAMGALVNTDNGKSIGLLLGGLRKLNGDGELSYIVSWGHILRILKKFSIAFDKVQIDKTYDEIEFGSNYVRPIVLKSEKGVQWGSCVRFKESVIVTNFHVVKPFCDASGKALCNIILSDVIRLTLSKSDRIITPHKLLDLSFILLSEESTKFINSFETFKTAEYDFNYTTGDEVMSVGYGLFYDQQRPEPIKTTGHICLKHELPFYSTNKQKSPSIFVTSASCWNGSSGGGIFSKRSNKMIGLVCSNAEVLIPFNSKTERRMTEKISRFCLCLPVEVIINCYKDLLTSEEKTLSATFTDTWHLRRNYTDIFVEPSKL